MTILGEAYELNLIGTKLGRKFVRGHDEVPGTNGYVTILVPIRPRT